jgi:hypothetical protein
MGFLNNANAEQRKLIMKLNTVANDCPPITDKAAFNDYQDKYLQPIRDAIIKAGEKND